MDLVLDAEVEAEAERAPVVEMSWRKDSWSIAMRGRLSAGYMCCVQCGGVEESNLVQWLSAGRVAIIGAYTKTPRTMQTSRSAKHLLFYVTKHVVAVHASCYKRR